jgi:hypothetical protein
MRCFYLFFLLTYLIPVYSQQASSACWVLYVKGEIKKPAGQKLMQGDTVSLIDLPSLKFETIGAVVNFYETSAGSFRMTADEIIAPKGHESFFIFLKHLLKIKGQPVSLSSRGECNCLTPYSCFFTDTSLNDKVLLCDKLTFKADDLLQKEKQAFYFLQYNRQKRKLRVVDNYVQLSRSDFVFKDTSFTEGETPLFTIGLYINDGTMEHSDLVANVKFNIVADTVLMNYYKALQQATNETDLLKLKGAFVSDVYLYFGKPMECVIDKIINSLKE